MLKTRFSAPSLVLILLSIFSSSILTFSSTTSLGIDAFFFASAPSLVLILLSIISSSILTFSSTTSLGIDAFFFAQYKRDPLAVNDSFTFLPTSIKKSLSVSAPSSNPKSLISQLLAFKISIPVFVKLVGPFSASSLSLLQSYASAALSSAQFQVIGSNSHHLAISHSLHLEATHSHLEFEISAAIRSHIDSSTVPSHLSVLNPVPYSVVDRIVRRDFEKESSNSAPGFYIYLLNLDQQSKRYAYFYDAEGSSPPVSNCLGTIWTGKERYMWIDLAAGPVDYGPALSGEGLLPRGEFHPLASLHKRHRSEKLLLADLASLVLSAYQTLLVPSLRIPLFLETMLLVQFIHIHGSDDRDPAGLDWVFIEQTLREGDLSFKDQTLLFKSYTVKYSECPICSFAIAKSMNSYTSRFLFENYTLIVTEYLDSKVLNKVLAGSIADIHRAAGITDDVYGKVLPVFVFDLDYDKITLLDRFHQAVAFRDMVIAVRTRNVETVSYYSCNGRHMFTHTRNLNRAIVGSVLQSMWGVTPTHLTWSPEHNKTIVDYTWSVGRTPFGPFSELCSISFVQRDAARRNVLLVSLNYTITSLIDLLESVATYGGDKKLLKHSRYVEFVQRWNLLKYKLEKFLSAMSQLDYDKAIFFLRSSDLDLYGLHTVIYQATQELDASLVCFKDPSFPLISAFVAVGILFGLFYVYVKREKLFRNKRKQF
ncbi:uncharacterized protein LOC110034039 [Phalaenopsis equestris]|uniref:uncharacterized protein LOC110034039 n=1 Tax=Phalaenopsis equestris TaxID=78828 RepID=UPI0009E36B9C|nr:uncharacterized protein LOC110034039 [Phalaenopsis equestris]